MEPTVLTKEQMIAIPRTGKKEHMLENVSMWDIQLTEEELLKIDRAYPKPTRKQYLDIV